MTQQQDHTIDDLLLIDKPKGITSFDVIRRLRKKTGIRKMGHAGTLDPLATGLLIVGIGPGTKKLKDLIGLSKTYRAQIQLGTKTDTGDLEGNIIEKKKIKELDRKKLENILANLPGTHSLQVPLYSTVKVGGKPLYKYARNGNTDIIPPTKDMTIHEVILHGHHKDNDFIILDIELSVSSGTYIRSIAEEIGRQLGCPATLRELRRTTIGNYSIKDAQQL